MVKVSKEICSKCKYRGVTDQKVSCNYLTCTGHSRLFEGGKMVCSPEFCMKYEEGDADTSCSDINIFGVGKDEYIDYKCSKIRKERSLYAYKHRKR